MVDPSDLQVQAIKSALRRAEFQPLADQIDPAVLKATGIPADRLGDEPVVAALSATYPSHKVHEVIRGSLSPEAVAATPADAQVTVMEQEDSKKMYVIMPASIASDLKSNLERQADSPPPPRRDLH